MALDVGDRRVGVAVSDPLGLTVRPLCTVSASGGAAVAEVARLIREQAASIVVLGLPYELDDQAGPQARKVHDFHRKLRRALEKEPELAAVRTVTWDERFTSLEAEELLRGSKLKNRDRRAAVDRVAAALILESYLAQHPFEPGR